MRVSSPRFFMAAATATFSLFTAVLRAKSLCVKMADKPCPPDVPGNPRCTDPLMTFVSLKQLVAAAFLFAVPLASARATPNVSVRNRTTHSANVVVRYAGCRSDHFRVPAGTLNKAGVLVEGVGRAPGRRGACQIIEISASFPGARLSVTAFKSQATRESNFTIQGTQTDVRVWSDRELASEKVQP